MAVEDLKILAQLAATLKKTMADGQTPKLEYAKGLSRVSPTDANLLYTNGFSIATSSSQSLDLSGSLADALGTTNVFSKVYAVLIQNLSVTTGQNIQIGGDSNHVPIFGAGADYATIGPGGFFYVTSTIDGWTVTAGTGDILKIANSAGGQTISVAVAVLGKS